MTVTRRSSVSLQKREVPPQKAQKTPRIALPVRKIENQRKANATFAKRKKGLFKKAYELGKLCDMDILVHIIPKKPGAKMHQYSSNPDPLVNMSRIVDTEDKDTVTVTSLDYERSNEQQAESSSDEMATTGSCQLPTNQRVALPASSFPRPGTSEAPLVQQCRPSSSCYPAPQDKPPPTSGSKLQTAIPVAESMFVLPPGALSPSTAMLPVQVQRAPSEPLFPDDAIACDLAAAPLVQDAPLRSPNGTTAAVLVRSESYSEQLSAVSSWWAASDSSQDAARTPRTPRSPAPPPA